MSDYEDYDGYENEAEDDEGVPSWSYNPWSPLYSLIGFAVEVATALTNALRIQQVDIQAAHNHYIDKQIEKRRRRLLIDDLHSLERGEKP